MPSNEPTKIALVGLRGSGKSTLGLKLANRLRVPFVELDVELVPDEALDANGVPLRGAGEFLAAVGPERFRAAESAALARVLAMEIPMVLATGGGVVEREENRALLRRHARCIWLRADPETLAQRVAADVAVLRPPLQPGGPLAEARALLARREAWYREVATLDLDTTVLPPDACIRRLRAMLTREG